MTQHPIRHSPRLRGYDYSQNGACFVTICTHNRECLFGEAADGEMVVNPLGNIAEEEWHRLATLRPIVEFDAFVVMPNHVHGIIVILGIDKERTRQALSLQPGSLSTIVGGYKSAVTRRIQIRRNTPH